MPPPVPTPIVRINDFTQWQADHPNAPLPGDWVAADFDQSNDGINLLQDRLALIQRDDGQLVNEIVTPESLDPAVLALLDDAQNTATQAAIDAAAAAAQSATDAANSAANAAASDADAQAAAAAATAAFAYEQGAETAQAAAETAAANAAASAAKFPNPPLTPGKGLVVNPAGTNYVEADLLTLAVDGKWDAKGHVVKGGADALAATDLTTLTQVQALIAAGGGGGGSGNVPPPVAGDVDKVLTATGAGAFNWLAFTVARISDATAFIKAFLTGTANAAQAQAYLGVPPTTRQIIAGTALAGGGDLSADRTLRLADTAVVTGTYGPATVTVDQQGRITAIANTVINQVPNPAVGNIGQFLKATAANVYAWAFMTAADISDATAYMKGLLTGIANAGALLANIGGVPTARVLTATAPITGGGDLSANRAFGHADTAVVPGTYTLANITVDQKGHVTAAANGVAAGALPTDVQEFNSGITNWVKPAGAPKMTFVQIWSAAGAGGRSTAGSAGGGGGGGYYEFWVPTSALGATESVTVGGGGVGITGADASGNPGGDSSFGSWFTVKGATGGVAGAAGTARAGGVGGVVKDVSNTGIVTNFGAFANGPTSAPNFYGGASGGNVAANNGANNGGDSQWGGAGAGGMSAQGSSGANAGTSGASKMGGAAGVSTFAAAGVATDGQQPGGGGGAARGTSGTGGAGRVRVSTFY